MCACKGLESASATTCVPQAGQLSKRVEKIEFEVNDSGRCMSRDHII